MHATSFDTISIGDHESDLESRVSILEDSNYEYYQCDPWNRRKKTWGLYWMKLYLYFLHYFFPNKYE